MSAITTTRTAAAVSSSPWGKKTSASIPPGKAGKKGGLLDIMSEQLAETLDHTLNAVEQPTDTGITENVLLLIAGSSSNNNGRNDDAAQDDAIDMDFALAAQLQEEEDAKRWEQERHGPQGNVTVQYFAHREPLTSSRVLQEEEEDEDEEDEVQLRTNQKRKNLSPATANSNNTSSGGWRVRDKTLKGQGGDGEIITKHDFEINGHKNARKMEQFVPNCGNLGDTLVPNRIFNSFQHKMKKQSHSEKGVVGRTVEADTTRSKQLDAKTRLVIHRMLDAGVLDAVNYVVRSGKEGVIFHAVGPADYDKERPGKAPFPPSSSNEEEDAAYDDDNDDQEDEVLEEFECQDMYRTDTPNTVEFAIKVYKTNLTEFTNRHEYVEGDHRFASVGQLSRINKQKIVKIWAEKELKNMTRMHRAGIPCPEPVRLDRNVLIMSFIGEDGWGAPQLADMDLIGSRAGKCFVQVLLLARALWDRCRLVHADLSEFNVLFLDGKCFVVDVGQAVERQHPNAMQFLRRDVFNVLQFFYNKCKKTGCGGQDAQLVDTVVDWIVNGPPNVNDDVDENEWCIYAKQELGSWADYRLACKFGELLLM